MKVLFDHNMPPSIARGLNEILKTTGHSAIPLKDKFDKGIDDIVYFDQLGRERNWIVISKDLKNARRKPEREAILRNNLLAFYLSPSLQKKKINEQAAAILWHWDKILTQAELTSRGLFQIPENKGKFKVL